MKAAILLGLKESLNLPYWKIIHIIAQLKELQSFIKKNKRPRYSAPTYINHTAVCN